MGAVQWVAGLKCHNAAPAKLAEGGAQFVGRVAPTAEIIVNWRLDAGDRATQIYFACGVMQIIHRRVRQIVCAKHLFCLTRFVGHPFVAQRHDGQDHAFGVAQCNILTWLNFGGELFAYIQRDRHRPKRAIGQAHVFHHAVIVSLRQKPLKRRKATIHQQFQITDLTRRQIP